MCVCYMGGGAMVAHNVNTHTHTQASNKIVNLYRQMRAILCLILFSLLVFIRTAVALPLYPDKYIYIFYTFTDAWLAIILH